MRSDFSLDKNNSLIHLRDVPAYFSIFVTIHKIALCHCLKKKQSTPRPSEHPPVMGEKMSKRLGGIKGCKYKTFRWDQNHV